MTRLARNLHVLFALLFTWWAVTGIIKDITFYTSLRISLVCVYWSVVPGIFRDRPNAWLLSIIPPAYIALRIGRMFITNVYMFATGHELYRDSPGTIIVVYIYGVVFLLPSVILVRLTLSNYMRLRRLSHQESR